MGNDGVSARLHSIERARDRVGRNATEPSDAPLLFNHHLPFPLHPVQLIDGARSCRSISLVKLCRRRSCIKGSCDLAVGLECCTAEGLFVWTPSTGRWWGLLSENLMIFLFANVANSSRTCGGFCVCLCLVSLPRGAVLLVSILPWSLSLCCPI